jgi:hypothetical protein
VPEQAPGSAQCLARPLNNEARINGTMTDQAVKSIARSTARTVLSRADRRQTGTPGHQEAIDTTDPNVDRQRPSKRAKSGKGIGAQSYIVFEARFARDLFCAVPKSSPIPDFLIGAGWTFRGTLSRHWSSLGGFKAAEARSAVEREGFYLFAASLEKT